MSDVDDGFIADLHALAAAPAVERTVLDDGERWRAPPAIDHAPLPIVIRWPDDDAVVVELGPWSHRFARDDDDLASALDLVAAALFGRARVHAWPRDDGRPSPFELAFRVGDRFVPFAGGPPRRWPWQPAAAVVHALRNAATPPAGIVLADAGQLPRAPWCGTLALQGPSSPGELAIDGELDLHNFHPREVDPLVRAYIDECLARGVFELRIVHGKGIGALRRTVQAILARHPAVLHHRLGGHGEGSWGATVVTLRRPAPQREGA